MKHGIDVSAYQDPRRMDYSAAYAAGVCDFVYVKASEGRGGIDPKALRHAQDAQAAGAGLGYYHFARPDSSQGDAKAEAVHFLSTLRARPLPTLPVALDLEAGDHALTPSDLTAWAVEWLGLVGKELSRPPVLYVNLDFLRHHLVVGGGLEDYAVWLAVRQPVEVITAAWCRRMLRGLPCGGAAMVQWCSDGRIAGYAGHVDRNVWLDAGAGRVG